MEYSLYCVLCFFLIYITKTLGSFLLKYFAWFALKTELELSLNFGHLVISIFMEIQVEFFSFLLINLSPHLKVDNCLVLIDYLSPRLSTETRNTLKHYLSMTDMYMSCAKSQTHWILCSTFHPLRLRQNCRRNHLSKDTEVRMNLI